jgi:multidrug efflux pump subunit AcrB
VIWTYSGLDADDMSKRIVGVCERALATSVNNIQYTESQSYSGVGVIKIHFQPDVQIDLAIAQVTALAQSLLRLMPPGMLPPYVLKYDASSVPIVQVSLGGRGLSQTELYDLGQSFIRGQLATIGGAAVPLRYGGEQRSIMVDLEPGQLAANHLSASDISSALANQNLVTPPGTEKIGNREYIVGTNSSPATIAELNSLPIRTANGAAAQMKDVAWIHNADDAGWIRSSVPGFTGADSGDWTRLFPLRRFRTDGVSCAAPRQARGSKPQPKCSSR